MGPLSPASAPRRRLRAFTLVELLVVIVVVGLAAGLIVANLGDDRRVAEREAARLAGALEHAADLAQWRGETLGVSADGRSYRFWQRGADLRWAALGGDDVLAPRALPPELSVTPLAWAGAPVAADSILPLAASGRNEPYTLALASPAWTVVIAVDPLNRVQLAGAPPAASR